MISSSVNCVASTATSTPTSLFTFSLTHSSISAVSVQQFSRVLCVLSGHLDTHQSAALSSTDLFWQSIALSVFLPKSNNSDVNWLSGATEIISGEQMNSGQNSSLDDVLQDILASFANTSLEYSKLVEHREPSCTEPNDLDACASSFSVACIDQTVCFTMGYKPMSQDIFNRLRQTFGCIECGYCGQLFLVQSDLDSHVNIHTGLFYCFCSSFLTFTSRQCFDIVGWQQEWHLASKKTGCWFVGGVILTGALHDL